MTMYLVFFVLSCFAVLGESSPHYWSNRFPSYRPYKVNSWGYNYGYLPYNYYQPLKGKDSTMTERTACKTCPETRPAPSTVTKDGLISKGMVMRNPDSSTMPSNCGPIFFSGNTDIFQVPDSCCTAEAGAEDWLPLEDFGSHEGIDGCYALDPFKNGAITAILVNGCYDDGTQFYGEKCSGSDFGEFSELAHGDCGPVGPKHAPCSCKQYVETKTPGCFAIATPEADPQFAVFVKAEGCANP